ncbi:Hypothetical predicted protein [Mytilus galloprovincialis]|uniref:LRAT domain-containing protein n=1 Tax=Mytilus galloprovincialis TaxID=29158 RepID=A0A8B6H5S7_MYTGA|nr:Hypothetical predicted protein [Mytilus galloprovincialis]
MNSGESYQNGGTGKIEIQLKYAPEDDNYIWVTDSDQQVDTHNRVRGTDSDQQADTNIISGTDSDQQADTNRVYFYDINEKSESVIFKKSKKSNNIRKDKSPGESNVINPSFYQRAPSHITVGKWTEEETPTKNVDSDTMREEKVNTLRINSSEKKITNDSAITDVIEHNIKTGNSRIVNKFIELTLESIASEDEHDNLLETNDDDEIERLPDDHSNKSCMDCIKPVPVKSWTEIIPGDHIILRRSFYYHHAILVGVLQPDEDNIDQIELDLIHQTNSIIGAVCACVCRRTLAELKRKTLIVNLKEVMVCRYWGRIQPKNHETVVRRAKGASEGDKEEFQYDIVNNNCEHFASWCVTGRRLSIQIRKVRIVYKIFCRSGLSGLGDELLRNKVMFEHGMLCKTCFERNEKMLDVTRKIVRQKHDIQKGDIILYKYYRLLHCSVVLDVVSRKDTYIKCKIAHYAFNGPFGIVRRKKIQSETKKFSLNGSVLVFDYSSGYSTYEPDEVVCRAKKRIGEKMFAYFSNDSSHYARWCKLKLSNSDK